MRIISYKIRRKTIEYEVKTDIGKIFSKSLPKKLSPYFVKRRLQKIADLIDLKTF